MTNPIPTTPKIFISHAWEDKAFVRRLEAELKSAGAEVWVDHSGVHGGDNLPKRISDALAWCDTILLIWSEAASKSHWVELEWTNALSLRKTIIPCVVSKMPLPALLANVLYVDCRDFASGFAQLQQALSLVLSATKPEPPPANTKERRIDAAVPGAAEVGRPIDLRVQVRFPDSPRLGLEDWPAKIKPAHLEQAAENVTLEFLVDAAGKLAAARLEIHVIAPDFDIAGKAKQILLVPPDALSKCLSFLMTPKRTGVCRLNVEVYNVEHIFLGAIPIETEVGGEVKAPATNVANLFLLVTVGQEKAATRSGKDKKSKQSGEFEPSGPAVVREPSERYEPIPQASRGCLSRAVLWLGLLVSLVTVSVFVFDLPQKLNNLFTPASRRFLGEVHDANGKGVEGAKIEVRAQIDGQLIGSDISGSHGEFDFQIKAQHEETVYVKVTRGDSVGFANYLKNADNQIILFQPFLMK